MKKVTLVTLRKIVSVGKNLSKQIENSSICKTFIKIENYSCNVNIKSPRKHENANSYSMSKQSYQSQ